VDNEHHASVASWVDAGRTGESGERARGTPLGEARLGAGAEIPRLPAREATVEIPGESAISGPIWLRMDTGVHGARPSSVLLRPGDEIVLGSEPGGSTEHRTRVDDVTVSARHCRVIHTGAAIEVIDLGSRNGVRVGGVRVPSASLATGGAFQIGHTTVRLDPGERPSAPDARPLPGLIGSSPPMRRLAASVRRIAALRLPVLLRGESGTGKDLVASAVHAESGRASGPFIAINAAAISRELAESELFGHRRGAFTGAIRDRRGAFREAQGGTLFLDEVGSISLEVQAKLLRAVEEGVVRPLGSEAGQAVDVRLIAATCEPLEVMVAERRFRPDLYERLAVCVVQVPALRERIDDIPALARHLLRASELGARDLSPGAIAALGAYRFPGNVRELRNVVVQAAVRAGSRIEAEHVAEVLIERTASRRRLHPEEALRIFEETGRNVSAAARRADLPRSTMRDLLRSLGAR
jgi:transcriptional regulator with AAA-type ATPase domain